MEIGNYMKVCGIKYYNFKCPLDEQIKIGKTTENPYIIVNIGGNDGVKGLPIEITIKTYDNGVWYSSTTFYSLIARNISLNIMREICTKFLNESVYRHIDYFNKETSKSKTYSFYKEVIERVIQRVK